MILSQVLYPILSSTHSFTPPPPLPRAPPPMAATAHAPPTLARSSPFLFSSPSPAPPRHSSLRPAPPRSDFLGCGGAGLRPPRGRRWRAPSPRLRRLLVRAALDGRSVVLALAAAAANFAVLRLVLLNFARLRKKSKEVYLSGAWNPRLIGWLVDWLFFSWFVIQTLDSVWLELQFMVAEC